MYKTGVILFVISAIFAFSETASIVDDLQKCGIKDDECQKTLLTNVLARIYDTGIPEMDIPVLDPYVIKNRELIVMGMVKLIMTDGVANDLKSCHIDTWHLDIDKRTVNLEATCDVFSIDGSYKLETMPTLDALIGGIKIHGDGKASIKIEKIHVSVEAPFEFKKLDDGELHGVITEEDVVTNFKVNDKVTITVDNLYIGSQEIGAVAANIFNENWNFITNSLGKPVLDQIVSVVVQHANKFFKSVPLTNLITDDLSSHASA